MFPRKLSTIMTLLILVAGFAFTLQTREGPPDKQQSAIIYSHDLTSAQIAAIVGTTTEFNNQMVYELASEGTITKDRQQYQKYGLYATAPGTPAHRRVLFYYLVRKPVTKKQQIYDVTAISHIDPGLRGC